MLSYPLTCFQKAPPKALRKNRARATPSLPCDDTPPGEEWFTRLPDWTQSLIRTGTASNKSYDSRSEAVFAVASQMVRCGFDDEAMISVLSDPENVISEHIRERGGSQMRAYAQRQVDRAREAVGSAASVADETIVVNDPNLHETVEAFGQLLRERSGKIFRRGNELVRLSVLDASEEADGVIRHAGLMELVSANPEWLRHEFGRVGGRATKVDRNSKGVRVETQVPPPLSIAKTLAAIGDAGPFDLIAGLSMTPSLTRTEPGYDRATGLVHAYPAGLFPPPPSPSRTAAEAALSRLRNPLRGFPFDDDQSHAAALAGMISAVIRNTLPTCPAFAIDAPAAGTGKSKLAELWGLLATGTRPSAMSYGDNLEEMEKRLATLLRSGDPMIMLDNVSVDLEGDFLCSMLSQEWVQARILGFSERMRLSTRTLVAITGNNLRFRGDIARRVVVVRLDAKMGNPEDRKFDFDCIAEVQCDRPQLVTDALTIVRSYIEAAPQIQLRPFGSFESWDLVRGALVWLGLPDPAETRQRATRENPQLEERARLFECWEKYIGINVRVTVAELQSPTHKDIRDVLASMTDKTAWNARSIGKLLSRHRDIPFRGLLIRSELNRQKVQTWWLQSERQETPQEKLPF